VYSSAERAVVLFAEPPPPKAPPKDAAPERAGASSGVRVHDMLLDVPPADGVVAVAWGNSVEWLMGAGGGGTDTVAASLGAASADADELMLWGSWLVSTWSAAWGSVRVCAGCSGAVAAEESKPRGAPGGRERPMWRCKPASARLASVRLILRTLGRLAVPDACRSCSHLCTNRMLAAGLARKQADVVVN
jgi:hypothetical protein